jgi:outer membrane protein OmpA-like peptidoglycan-associated protein
MRLLLRSAAVLFAMLIALPIAHADPVGTHVYVTPFGGWTHLDGNFRTPGGYTLADGLNVGGRLGLQWRPWLALEVAGGYSPVDEETPTASLRATFTHASGNFVYSPWAGRFLGPYLFLGGGAARISYGDRPGVVGPALGTAGATYDQNFTMGTLDFGGGVKFWLTDALGLRLEGRRLHHMVIGGGITLALGAKPRDTDRDGVPDRKDKCPDTPLGAKVDANGCPLDSDGDKVFDGLDQCEGTPAGCQVDARGCPIDTDGDGVCDGVDACADTPKGATVDAKGCPADSDGDGVFDGLDQCPATPKGATVDAKGCPTDSDGDGVFDGLDQCPGTAPGLKVDPQGCPIEVSDRETELLDTGMIRLEDVHFETAKADILPIDMPRLDVVGQVLSKWPELKIEIGGHTDARGSRPYNQRLSQARARSVLDYLVKKFPDLKPDQFTAKGYGEDRPIAPNNGEPNWSRNRRVEFVVQNKEVLKKERERRRLLKVGEPAVPETLITAPPDTTR